MDTTTLPVNFSVTSIRTSRRVSTLEEDVREGLTGKIKRLHPKFFYDEVGSQLFDRICDTPEYYLTRTEYGLLQQHSADIIARAGPKHLLELGSGTSRKTRLLLDAWSKKEGTHTYWPFDVSARMLKSVAADLALEYPGLEIHALIGDYTAGLCRLPDMTGTTLALFVGSTLGNFKPDDAGRFLSELVSCLKPGDFFLLGVDLDKDPNVLRAAYNDAQGITEAFNKNILAVVNRKLDAQFDLDKFTHRAFYNHQHRQMEMHLDATQRQTVAIEGLGLVVDFEAGESIWTEISRKYTLPEIDELFDQSGLAVVDRYIDQAHLYALILGQC
jgi:L-histidine N-alpha-methyltransferase